MLPLAHRWAALDILYGHHWHPLSTLPISRLGHLILNLGLVVTGSSLDPQPPQLDQLSSLSIVDTGTVDWTLLSQRIGNCLRSLELRTIRTRSITDCLLAMIAANPGLEQLKIS
ncbi:hypothetical protein FRB90_005302, partial [Tulasnella sp. 427]